MSSADHFTDPHGRYINICPTQDALGPNCPECGRTAIPRVSGGTTPEPWQHTTACSQYQPHPLSVAGQPGYSA